MSKNVPLVSVVVPNYNYVRYLEQRLSSILDQTFQDFELILLDDASDDGSADILARYRDNPHTSCIVVNEKNSGSPFKQWMKGIALAKGKYVWIAEADDWAEPDFLETCIRWVESEENVSVGYVGSVLFDADGKVERKDVNHWGKRTRWEAAVFDGECYARCNLYWRCYIINASGALFRREFALGVDWLSICEMRYCGDWMFWFEMAMKGRVVEVYRKLNYFRQHAAKVTTASRRTGDGIREDVQIVRYMEQRLKGISAYRKRLRRGLLYRKISRMRLDTAVKRDLYTYMYEALSCTPSVHKVERLNQIFRILNPKLPTAGRDRL